MESPYYHLVISKDNVTKITLPFIANNLEDAIFIVDKFYCNKIYHISLINVDETGSKIMFHYEKINDKWVNRDPIIASSNDPKHTLDVKKNKIYYKINNGRYQIIQISSIQMENLEYIYYYFKVITILKNSEFICENNECSMTEHEFKTYTKLKNITDLDIPIPSDEIIYDELKNSKKSVYKNCEVRVEKFSFEYYTITCIKTFISIIDRTTKRTREYIISLDEFNDRYVIRDMKGNQNACS